MSDNQHYLSADGFAGYDAIALTGQSHDMIMFVESKGAQVEGESTRIYGGRDGKKKGIDLIGWHFGGFWPLDFAAGRKAGNVRLDQFCIVKKIDSTTATFGKFFKSNTNDLKIEVAAYKAGETDMVRFIKLIFEAASMTSWQVYTSEKANGFLEAMSFSFRDCTVDSAMQLKSGATGAANTVQFNRGNDS